MGHKVIKKRPHIDVGALPRAEVIKALRCCGECMQCTRCPLDNMSMYCCNSLMLRAAELLEEK